MQNNKVFPSIFAQYRGAIDEVLRTSLFDNEPGLDTKLRYHMGWVDKDGHDTQGNSGKALRPTLCLFACQFTSGDYRPALPAAAAIELIHNFSLIHDDIQDGDKERRHQPTVWWIWGKEQAFQAGVAMNVIASMSFARMANNTQSASRLLKANKILGERCLQMIEGQYLDISFESRLDITVEDYLDMISRKTGALIGCSLELGSLYGGADERTISCLHNCGSKLGLTFQIRDDMLGVWGDPGLTGKPIGSDIRRKKKSLPVIHAFQHADSVQRAELENIYQYPEIGDKGVDRVLGVMNDLGTEKYAWQMARRYHQEALSDLEMVKLSPPDKKLFYELADFLVDRNY